MEVCELMHVDDGKKHISLSVLLSPEQQEHYTGFAAISTHINPV